MCELGLSCFPLEVGQKEQKKGTGRQTLVAIVFADQRQDSAVAMEGASAHCAWRYRGDASGGRCCSCGRGSSWMRLPDLNLVNFVKVSILWLRRGQGGGNRSRADLVLCVHSE